MTDLDLSRGLRTLRRTVLMLQTELRHGRVEVELLTEIDARMERGIASDPRCAALVTDVDALRESIITPRPELKADAIKACSKLMDDIAMVLDKVG
ncbi:MAG: hypothetical protein IPJ76_14805 [Flavobacteriales bacterium]|nr:MAG: hypothetical protein IPJ76_14805 [Flavobacteriales bacterium]